MDSKIPLLHIYGQAAWHDEVRIIGNKDGLLALRNAITKALNSTEGNGVASVYASDGEGYEAGVLLNDSGWQGPFWYCVGLPYTKDYTTEEVINDTNRSY